jgi:hypothetical protein
VSEYSENVIGNEGGRVAGTELRLTYCGRTFVAAEPKKQKEQLNWPTLHYPTSPIASVH